MQSSNVLLLRTFRVEGMVTLSKLRHPAKQLFPIFLTPSDMFAYFKLEQPQNAPLPMDFTFDGIVIFSIPLSENALEPIESILSGSITLVSLPVS